MNFIESKAKEMVDHLAPKFPRFFDSLSYPMKVEMAFYLWYQNFSDQKKVDRLDESMMTIFSTVTLISPFVVGDSDAYSRSIVLEANEALVNDLSGRDLPSNVDGGYFQRHQDYSYWFVQFPGQTFECEQGIWLEGVFYVPEEGNDVVAVICRTTAGEYIYLMTFRGMIQSTYIPVNRGAFLAKAKTLAQLAILHFDSKRQQGHEFVERAKYPKEEDSPGRKNKKKQGRRNLKYSLFRSIDLDYRGDYRGASSGERVRKPFEHRFQVRGHFRWQAYGKQYSKHKLIWIDAFEKGEGERDNRAQLARIG